MTRSQIAERLRQAADRLRHVAAVLHAAVEPEEAETAHETADDLDALARALEIEEEADRQAREAEGSRRGADWDAIPAEPARVIGTILQRCHDHIERTAPNPPLQAETLDVQDALLPGGGLAPSD